MLYREVCVDFWRIMKKKLVFILRYNWKFINIKFFMGVNDRVYEEIYIVFIKLILE